MLFTMMGALRGLTPGLTSRRALSLSLSPLLSWPPSEAAIQDANFASE